jgi:hypothetical protein
MSDEAENDFLIVAEAAEVMRMSKRTLDNHRCKGTGPNFRRHGGRIVYRRCDLLEWSEQRSARTAGKRISNSPSRAPIGRNGLCPSGSENAQRFNAALERQPKRSSRSIHGHKTGAGKRPIGSGPPA